MSTVFTIRSCNTGGDVSTRTKCQSKAAKNGALNSMLTKASYAPVRERSSAPSVCKGKGRRDTTDLISPSGDVGQTEKIVRVHHL